MKGWKLKKAGDWQGGKEIQGGDPKGEVEKE